MMQSANEVIESDNEDRETAYEEVVRQVGFEQRVVREKRKE